MEGFTFPDIAPGYPLVGIYIDKLPIFPALDVTLVVVALGDVAGLLLFIIRESVETRA